jgi:predicted nucleic acid-binding Zn ribbon protein
MADLLNFSPSRKLEFDSSRPLEFDSRRPLEFDSRRALDFNMNRDLGFGRRGVVFRGFICPICGALVTEDAKRCNECGAIFEPNPRAAGPPAGRPPTVSPGPPKAASPTLAPPKSPAAPGGAVYCAYCGAALKRGNAFCWNCGARTDGGSGVVRLPTKKAQPVSRDWRRGR